MADVLAAARPSAVRDEIAASLADAIQRVGRDSVNASASRDLESTYRALGVGEVLRVPGQSPAVLVEMFASATQWRIVHRLVEDAFLAPWLSSLAPDHLADASRIALADPAATDRWPVQGAGIKNRAGKLFGAVSSVSFAAADVDEYVVVVTGSEGEQLAAVQADAPGLIVEPVHTLDAERPAARVRFNGAAARLIPTPPGTVEHMRHWLQVFTAAQLLGVAEAVFELARGHSLLREQFGRPIAGFQAVRHQLAELATKIVALHNLLDLTAAELDNRPERERRASAAIVKIFAADTALATCEGGLQILGGIGFVEEHELHRYFKTMLRLHDLYGAPRQLRLELGTRER